MKEILKLNLSGIYERGSADDRFPQRILNLSDIEGTRGYCSPEAAEEIRKRLEPFSEKGIHLLDSGNYHYLTEFWLEKIEESFGLIVFDHHTDMQPSAFGDILSCGSWIYDVIRQNARLRQVLLVGAEQSFLPAVDPSCKGHFLWISEEEKDGKNPADLLTKALDCGIPGSIPVYVSIDKDVLSKAELETDWDQGRMSLQEMTELLKIIFEKRRVIGVDICGEPPADASDRAVRQSEAVNRKLVRLLSPLFQGRDCGLLRVP